MGIHLSAELVAPGEARLESRLSLMFRPGRRPAAADVLRLAQAQLGSAQPAATLGFAVSHRPDAAAGWLELLAGGMTFDLVGLAPTVAAPIPAMAHFYGFTDVAFAKPAARSAEAITLIPGDQLRGAESLLPVMRIMVGLAARLAELADVSAVVWHPARCAMAPDAFVSAVGQWRQGGAFPALGLTAIFRDDDGAIRSEGLAFFIGRELWIEPIISKNTAEQAQIATRLINQLVGSDSINQPFETLGPNGEQLTVEPTGSDGLLKVWGKS